MKPEQKRIPPTHVRTRSTADKPADTLAPAGADGIPEKTDRVTFYVKDGKVDWGKVRETRQPALRKLLADSLPAAAAPAAAPAHESALNENVVGMLYDVLGQLGAIAAARTYKCSLSLAMESIAFSETDKKVLAGPTIAVLDKYLPASMLDKYGAEVILLMTLTMVGKQKITALQENIAKHRPQGIVKPEPVK